MHFVIIIIIYGQELDILLKLINYNNNEYFWV